MPVEPSSSAPSSSEPSSVANFYVKSVKEFIRSFSYRTVPIFIAVLIGTFLFGVHVEYKFGISQQLPYYLEEYKQSRELEEATQFASEAQKIVNAWTIYHATPSNSHVLRTASKYDAISLLYRNIDIKQVNTSWQIYLKYFNAYLSFICADLQQSESCLSKAIQEVEAIESLKDNSLHQLEVEWLIKNDIFEQIALLRAYCYALAFKYEPSSKELEQRASEALKKLGNKWSPKDEMLQEDRILGPLFRDLYKTDKS